MTSADALLNSLCAATAAVGHNPVHIVPSDVVYADGASDLPLQRTDCSNQLTLSFRGQVFVFDDVTTDKVRLFYD